MSEETSGEIRIMGALAKMAKELEDVRTIATGRRAEESDMLETHETEIRELKRKAIDHESRLINLDVQMGRLLSAVTTGNITGEMNSKKLNALLEKFSIDTNADGTPKLTRPKP